MENNTESGTDIQKEANQYYYGWALDHQGQPGKAGGQVAAIEFDPVNHPEQLLENALVEIDPRYKLAPSEKVLSTLERNIGEAMRSETDAQSLVRYIIESPTSAEDPTPLPESIKKALAAGESIGLIFAHQILMDIGYGASAITCALQTTEYMDRNLIVLNKAMAFEKFNGIPYTWMSKPFSNAVFVSPKTASAQAREIPEHIEKAVNYPAARVIHGFAKKGAMFIVALHGTAMETDSQGRPVMPPTDPASAGLVEKCDHLLRFAFYKNPATGELSWNLGPLERLQPPQGAKHDQRKYYHQAAEIVQQELAQQIADLSGLPVVLKEKETENQKTLGSTVLAPLINL